jgi:ABC-type multidrug transport system fused ATPase/permease subunit
LVSVIIGGGARMASGELSVAAFAAFLLYLLQLVSPVTIAATGIGRLQAGLAARGRFDELLAMPQEADQDEPGAPAPEPVAAAPAVSFHDVAFSYPGVPAIRDFSFSAPRTGLTALVGPSGAGKTTTLSLIDRFVHADGGRIEVLGHDIRAWPLTKLRHRVAYVDQQFTLMEGTARENLSLGKSAAVAEATLRDALAAVGLLEDIMALEDGIDTVLGRDIDLSGGQRQRLALARVLLTDADVVLLDEPTSQQDGINEKRFRELVSHLATTKAVLIVAHRLSTVRHADHVLMVTNGTVIDSGTHHQLMDRCGAYRELVLSQTGSPRLEAGVTAGETVPAQ